MSRDMFDDLEAYSSVDLAGKHRSDAGTQAKVRGELLDELMQQIEESGYVIIEGVLSAEVIERIRADVSPRFRHRGRNNFEGFATQRLYAVIQKTMVCNELVEHPVVLGLLDRILEPNYLLSQLQVINVLPGEKAQPLHFDDAFYPWPRPRPALGAATIWAIDDFTADNGATVAIPGSHRWGTEAPGSDAATVPIVMPAGSVVFFLGTLWHGAGANRTDTARQCVTAQYCAPWCRTQENFSLSVDRDRARACSTHVQRMLGYNIHRPFMGFVDGVHPKRLLED